MTNPPSSFAPFSSDALQFLRELAANNDRAWFAAHRARFESALRDPFVAFLVELAPRLAAVNDGFVVDARSNGGSLARMHRDMRFARAGDDGQRQPFKTALSAHFARPARDDVSLFVSLEPGRTRVGCAVTGATRRVLQRALKKRDEEASSVLALIVANALPTVLDVHKGPRRFLVTTPIADDVVATGRFLDDVVEACLRIDPFVRFVDVLATGATTDHGRGAVHEREAA